MFLSGSIHKGDLATLHRAAGARAAAFEQGLRSPRNDEDALGLALKHERFLALVKKLATAYCERPVFLTLDEVERSVEALAPLHRTLGRDANRSAFREVDALMRQLEELTCSLKHEEY